MCILVIEEVSCESGVYLKTTILLVDSKNSEMLPSPVFQLASNLTDQTKMWWL